MRNRVVVPLIIISELRLPAPPGEELVRAIGCHNHPYPSSFWHSVALLPVHVDNLYMDRLDWSNDNASGIFHLQTSTLFTARENNRPFSINRERFELRCKEGLWLMVYCRTCRCVFQAHQIGGA